MALIQVFLFLVVCLTTSLQALPGPGDGGAETGCSAHLARCRHDGQQVILAYTNDLRERQAHRATTCRYYEKVESCVHYIERQQCAGPEANHLKTWLPALRHLSCVCHNTTSEHCQSSVSSHSCLEQHYASPFAKYCDVMLAFNIDNYKRATCTFMVQAVRCRQSLIGSVCGSHASAVAVSLARVELTRLELTANCTAALLDTYLGYHGNHALTATAVPPYHSFKYDEQCQSAFVTRLNKCTERYLTVAMLDFYTENDLVTRGSVTDVKLACSVYRKHRVCVQSLADQCPAGLHMAMQYEHKLRRYTLKMDIICDRHFMKRYQSHLTCFQQEFNNGSSLQCERLWKHHVKQQLQSVTPYTYFCQPSSTRTQKIKLEVENLAHCYDGIYKDRCGEDGGDVMMTLISRALQDPFYLRYDYMPDCHYLNHVMQHTTGAASNSVSGSGGGGDINDTDDDSDEEDGASMSQRTLISTADSHSRKGFNDHREDFFGWANTRERGPSVRRIDSDTDIYYGGRDKGQDQTNLSSSALALTLVTTSHALFPLLLLTVVYTRAVA